MVDIGLPTRLANPLLRGFPWRRPRDGGSAVDLVIVQDDSSSMYRSDGAAAHAARLEAVCLAISLLGVRARVGFIAFGTVNRGRSIPPRPVATEDQRRQLIAEVKAATYEKGGTDYGDALRAVVDALTDGDGAYGWPPYRADGRTAGVLLVSDGRVRDAQQLRQLREMGGVYETLRERGVPVFTVGVENAVREPEAAAVLREMAMATGGNAYLARTPGELMASCAAVIAELGSRRPHRSIALWMRIGRRYAA